MKSNTKQFVERLNELAPERLQEIYKYGLIYEVFSTFSNESMGVEIEGMSDQTFINFVDSAMLEWDI